MRGSNVAHDCGIKWFRKKQPYFRPQLRYRSEIKAHVLRPGAVDPDENLNAKLATSRHRIHQPTASFGFAMLRDRLFQIDNHDVGHSPGKALCCIR